MRALVSTKAILVASSNKDKYMTADIAFFALLGTMMLSRQQHGDLLMVSRKNPIIKRLVVFNFIFFLEKYARIGSSMPRYSNIGGKLH